MNTTDMQQTPRFTWLDRLSWKLFPWAPPPRLDTDPRTFMTTRVGVYLEWKDRLRVLISGRLSVQVVTYTDVVVHDAESLSVIHVEAPRRGR
jgi:hypothetical protein